jgi:hypothetical protein
MASEKDTSKSSLKELSGTIALVISIFAFFISIINAYETRQHNRLSLRPYLQINFIINETGLGWTILQTGLGIAIVKTFEVTVDGKPVTGWKNLFQTLNIPTEKIGVKYNILYKGNALMPKTTSSNLLWIPPNSTAVTLAQNANRIEIKVCYCSIYEECWLTSSESTSNEIPQNKVRICPETTVQFTNDFF